MATQSEDLLGLMDALGIRRAVLVGRQPANQDMTWIAEHHPERVAGLVYMGNPLVFPDMRNPLVRTFEEMTWRSCDLGERSVPIVGPRAAWRPDFLHDEHARIDMPALRFVSPWDTRTVALRVLPQIAATGVNSRCDDEPRREYFAALAADEAQVAAIRQALEEADLFPALDRAMERAFGGNLRTEVDDLPKRDGWGATHEFYEPHMRRFLEEVARTEADRPDEPIAASLPPTAAENERNLVHVAPPTEPLYESRFVETRGVRLQYADFGGSGLPIIFIQNIHDWSLEERSEMSLLARLTDGFRVLAPVRRGYGDSDDTGWGYDVATQAEDVVGFMDALGIRRAILVGGPPAPQEMTWIAEHHPERVAGLVYLAAPHVESDFRNPEIRAFVENNWRGSCDLGETAVPRIGPRVPWRPHFLDDETVRIDVPALRFIWPASASRSMDVRRLDRVPQLAAAEPSCDGEAAAREYFIALAADQERLAALRQALTESDPSLAMDSAMVRAFGPNLRTVVDPGGWDHIHDFVYAHIRRFVDEVARSPATAPGGDAGVVHVAPPTGDRETDRASILAALGDVEPGGTVQFAPGTYLMGGQIIRITIPRVTLAGHAEGTTLRGCYPDEFSMENTAEFGNNCNGIELAGGWQTVRNLTIEHAFWALHVGCCWDSSPHMMPGEGGHLIEGNTFRSNSSAVRVHGYWSEPTVIRNNRILNNWHSVAIYGNTVHLIDNDISAPEPEAVPGVGFPADGIFIAWPPSLPESAEGVTRTCDNNVVSGNRIDGVTEGIMITADDPQIICRNNIIRDNTIIIRRARPPAVPGFIRVHDEADSTVVGVPLALRGGPEDNLIEGNVIQGAEGLGIEIRRASRNRIVNNTISGVARREPFPGNAIVALPVVGGDPEAWRDANGSGIWLSPGSDRNEIVGNVFEDIAGAAVVLEGDSNLVITSKGSDGVRDLGAGNRVITGAATSAAPQPVAQQPRTITERLVDVGGFQMQVWTGGPQPSEGGPPLVVFENGDAGTAGTWAEVAEEVGSFAPFLAYNRGGRGLSEWDGEPPTPEHVARRLRDLLDVLDLSPPYLLVGHSWGANLVREHAALHPDAVAGLVYVDPYAPCALERAFEIAGFGPLVAEFTDFLGQRPGPVPDPLHLRMDRELGSGAPPDIPVVLMVGLTEGPPPPGAREWMVERGIDPDEILAALRELKVPCLSSMALEVPRGKLIATPFSGHDIQQDEPELVVEAIRWVLSRMPSPGGQSTGNIEVVHVAPPTGEKEIDHASILTALEQVPPSGTVQFAAGTYLIGEIITVTVPRVTLVGHPDGTTLRGCDPDGMGTREYAMARCNGIELAGRHQTVRDLTFEYAYWALHLGCCFGERAMLRAPDGTLVEGPAIYRTDGGHLVEGNTFRRSATGIRMNGDWSEPAVVRGNRFVDNWHSVSINGNTVHLLNNDFSVPEPEKVPFYGFPNDAVQIGAPLPFQGAEETRARTCEHNVVAGNTIDGSHNGISIMLWAPGTSCRGNVIRDNTITVRRARVPSPEWFTLVDESDSTFVGNPLSLLNFPEAFGQNERGQESAIEDNLIEGNRIIGAEGLGIEVLHASGNRFVNNTITGIALRTPFPGNTMTTPLGQPTPWRQANGSAIWISPGSDGNEIAGNEFEDIAAFAVVVEGDGNRVDLTDPADAVRDLGTGNRVSGPDTTTSPPAYESKFVEGRGVRLHYLDFGGTGLPVIFVHDWYEDAHTWTSFAPLFADAYRVLAMTRRGYGESDDVGWGYDVATQSEDILGFMDALGIERAVLVGRHPTTQDMTWIAEHHPSAWPGWSTSTTPSRRRPVKAACCGTGRSQR
ncbi:MAG TPA: alpha/beta fold hydrolase [Longimicrobiales bacterium]|nr:alpha/beta fold hydrolase [Longimicrobiales bacterium]